jgi:hypothetical protein
MVALVLFSTIFLPKYPPALLGELAAVFPLPLYAKAVSRLVGADSQVQGSADCGP